MAIDERQLFQAVELDMSPDFRRRLERDLLAAASADVEPTNSTVAHASRMDDSPSLRRAWVTASAAALLIAATVGVTAIRLNREPSPHDTPSPTTVPTTTTPAPSSTTSTTIPQTATPGIQRGGGAVVFGSIPDIDAINLDPWLPGGPTSWSATDDDGPYLVFDLTQLPTEWRVVSVEGSHPLSEPGYIWNAQLTTGSIEATLSVDKRVGFSYPALSAPVTIRGRDGFESTENQQDTLYWHERSDVHVKLSSPSPSASADLHALAESLQQKFADSMGPQPAWPPPDGGPPVERGSPELSGTISGHAWTVDTSDESTSRSLFPRVDRVLLEGISIDSADNPTEYGIASTAVIGGVMVLAVLPSEVHHAMVNLSDSSTIGVPGYRWTDRTGIVIPIPHGLDATSIDFQREDGTTLQHMDIPEYPPVVSGATFEPYFEGS